MAIRVAEMRGKMKTLLEKAWNGTETELLKVAERIKALPRDKEGVFIIEETEGNVYSTAGLVYPVYMEYETKCNKKAGYMDIAFQMQVLAKRVKADYTAETAAGFLKVLTDTLKVTSPEIYEHYRMLQDLLKETVQLVIEKENLEMTAFPEKRIKTDLSGRNRKALKLAGEAIAEACEKGFLFAEKYETLGQQLAALA